MIYQGLRDRLLVWYSHCEVQMQQIENGTTTEPLQMLNQLQEEIHNLDGMRAEIFHMGQALVQQGTSDIQPDLDDFLRVENVTMLKLAQMRISFAQQPPESTQVFSKGAATDEQPEAKKVSKKKLQGSSY